MGQTTAQYRRRGQETNVPLTAMSDENRREWERREREHVARLRAEFWADPELQPSQMSSGGEDWEQHDRRRVPRPASLRSRLLEAVKTRVGQIMTSRELAGAIGVRFTSGVSHQIAALVRMRVLERTKCGVYRVMGRAAT